MDKVRIGIIGAGNMGSSHARWIRAGDVPGLELTAMADRNADRVKEFDGVEHFAEGTELISKGQVDAVLIATPHYDHTILGIQSLEKGLHTLVEKPISVHKADCEKLIAAHQDPKVIFAAMFNQRTDPHYTKLKSLIDSGELGEIRRVVWNITNWFRTYAYYASGGWRATWAGEGGGVLLNQCPHQLDLWQWLFGMPAKLRAFCDIGRYHEIEVEDDVTCYMEYANGCKGVFITTTGEAPGTNRLEITAERGKVVIEGEGISFTRNEVPMTEWSRQATGGFTKPSTWDVKIPISGSGDQHRGIMRNFTNAIRKGEPLIAPAAEGIHSVELANAMLFSAFRDETVTMPLDSAAYADFLQKKIETSTFVKKTADNVGATDFASSY